MKLGVLALLAIGAVGIAGCEFGVEPVGPGPVAYDTYYWGGYYDGPYWVYRDHDGHYFREARAVHEERAHAFEAHGGHFAGHAEFHGGGHEGAHGGEGHER